MALKNFLRALRPEESKGAFFLCFFVCLAAGLFIIWVVTPLTGIGRAFGPGHDGYIELARSLASGDGYVFEAGGDAVFHRPPFYPLLLVPVALLPAGLERTGLVVLQSLMVGGIGALVFAVGRRLFSVKTGQIAVILFLMYPWVYWHAKNPMTPILQGLLYILFAALLGRELLGRGGEKRQWAGGLALGVTAGALALTHGAMLAVGGVAMALLFAAGVLRKDYGKVKTAVIAAAVMLCAVGPWTYRNWVVFGRFIPVVSGGGLAYFNGVGHWDFAGDEAAGAGENYIDASLRITGIGGTEATHTHFKGLRSLELDDRVNEKMVEHIREEPARFVKMFFLNGAEYYFPVVVYPFLANKYFSIEGLGLTIFHAVLWGLAIWGICRRRRCGQSARGSLLLLGGTVFYAVWYFPFATFIGHWLYSFGTIPLLVILAASGFGAADKYKKQVE